MPKKKVVVITGPGHHDVALADILRKKGFQVKKVHYYPHFAVCTAGEKSATPLFSLFYNTLSWFVWAVSARWFFLKNKQRKLNILFPVYDFFAAFFLNHPDLLIGWSQVSLLSLKRAKRRGAVTLLESPMIHVSEWNALLEEEYEKFPKLRSRESIFSKPMLKRMLKEYKTAAYINVLSTYAASTFIANGVPASKLLVTAPGIDTTFFIPPKNKKQEGKFIVLFAGRLQLLKGVHNLIQAFKKVQLPEAELWLCGLLFEEIKPFLEHTKNIKILPVADRTALLRLYQSAHLFVLPSIQESFGLVLAEAMACALPVLASTNSGALDLIKDPQFLFSPQKEGELEQKLLWCYENKVALEKAGQRNLSYARKVCSLEKYEERFASNLARILKQ